MKDVAALLPVKHSLRSLPQAAANRARAVTVPAEKGRRRGVLVACRTGHNAAERFRLPTMRVILFSRCAGAVNAQTPAPARENFRGCPPAWKQARRARLTRQYAALIHQSLSGERRMIRRRPSDLPVTPPSIPTKG